MNSVRLHVQTTGYVHGGGCEGNIEQTVARLDYVERGKKRAGSTPGVAYMVCTPRGSRYRPFRERPRAGEGGGTPRVVLPFVP